MGVAYDPNHPHRPRGYVDSSVQAHRDAGEEAPWLLAWKDGRVMVDPETGRYRYDDEVRAEADRRGRGGRRA
jgi:hypothetical protein